MFALHQCTRLLPIFCQVHQYVSRAEELKALVASDNRTSFEEARSARDILRGNGGGGGGVWNPSVLLSWKISQ